MVRLGFSMASDLDWLFSLGLERGGVVDGKSLLINHANNE